MGLTDKNRRLKIGLLVSEYYDDFMREACVGAIRAAEEADSDLYLLTGGYLKSNYNDSIKNNYEFQNNAIFDFAVGTGLDALVVYLGNIANSVDDQQRRKFLEKFSGIPVITVASEMEGFSSILFDNKGGFAHGVEYLVTEQGRRRIGFVSGPATSVDANERLEAYREVLQKYHLPCTEEQIVYGNFSEYSEDIVRELLDRNPDLDAIAFANDSMARGAYHVLEERGISVGNELAVIGFDDADFAKLMTPSLTTTKADPQELGYQAFRKVCEMIEEEKKTGEKVIREYRVDTTLIIRESCGGRKESMIQMNEKFDPTMIEISRLVEMILFKIFDYGDKNSNLPFLRENIYELVRWMNMNVYDREISYSLSRAIVRKFSAAISKLMSRMKETTAMFDLTQHIFNIYNPFIKTDAERIRYQEAKADIYRSIQVTVERRQDENLRDSNVLKWIMMDITRDTNGSGEEKEKYGLLLRKMEMLSFPSSFILLYPEIMHCDSIEDWHKPEKLQIKAYQRGKDCVIPEEDNSILPTDEMFIKADGSNRRRKTMVVSVLFSGYDQYGLLAMETGVDNLLYIEPLRFQISSALQTMSLFNDKEKMTRQLQINLLELKESNAFLDEVSKSDELTQIYNRRGFLVTTKKIVRREENYKKKALCIYADMNNLKLVNDRFGHEEGDYSLKSVADILKASLGAGSIVGRMGGDEFAAFLMADDAEYAFDENAIRQRITEETEKLNAGNDKQYYVSLSAGMRFFTIDENTDFDQMISEADTDLYQWKKVKRKEILK